MEALHSFETSLFTSKWRYFPERLNLQEHRWENLESLEVSTRLSFVSWSLAIRLNIAVELFQCDKADKHRAPAIGSLSTHNSIDSEYERWADLNLQNQITVEHRRN
jgi:hypothetical protein